jgi:uncharacterized protein YecE (DUF72 family)
MKFGQGEAHGISLKLPETALAAKIAPKTPPSKAPLKIILGAPIWGCAGWKGSLYPENAKPNDFLLHYARALGAIELNATFYGFPPQERIKKWAEQTPADFKFCPKLPRGVSNSKELVTRKEIFERFWKEFSTLEQKLGPSFIQFSETTGPNSIPEIEELLVLKPPQHKLAVEFRHPEFFDENKLIPELQVLLEKHHCIAVISDTLAKRYSLHQFYSQDFAFVRFLGAENPEQDLFRLTQWTNKLEELAQKGLKEVYFFVHQPNEVHAAETLAEFSQLCQSKKSLMLDKPIELFSRKQAELF